MSSSPKYSNVNLVGDAASALSNAVTGACKQAADLWEVWRENRRAERLRGEQAEVAAGCQGLTEALRLIEAADEARTLGPAIAGVRQRLDGCAADQALDLSASGSLLREMREIDRDLTSLRRQLEAVRLSRALDGVAQRFAVLKAKAKQLDRRDSERFDPGAFKTITELLSAIDHRLAARNLAGGQAAVTDLAHQLDVHVQRVQSSRDVLEQRHRQSQEAIAGVTDRHGALCSDVALTAHLRNDLNGLQRELDILPKLLAGEQFDNVQLQVARLSAAMDRLADKACQRIEQIEKQKAIITLVMETVASMRGTILTGSQQQSETGTRVIMFRIDGRRAIHMEIGIDGPIKIRPEGFKHLQRLGPDDTVEKSCDEFVEWFERFQQAASYRGEFDLRWDGSPTPERSQAAGRRTTREHVKPQTQSRRTH